MYFSGQQKARKSRNYHQCFLKDSSTNIKCCEKIYENIDFMGPDSFLLNGSIPDLRQFPFKYVPLKPLECSECLLCGLHEDIVNIFELLFAFLVNLAIRLKSKLFSPRQKINCSYVLLDQPVGSVVFYQSIKYQASIFHECLFKSYRIKMVLASN